MNKKMSTLMNTSDCNKENAKCIDASDIKGKILPSCRTQEERWQEAFLNLADKDPNSKHKTILKDAISRYRLPYNQPKRFNCTWFNSEQRSSRSKYAP